MTLSNRLKMVPSLAEEEWRHVLDGYEVSSLGRVRSPGSLKEEYVSNVSYSRRTV